MSTTVATLRVGRLIREGTIVKPDARKGELKVFVDDQELVHFSWKERDGGVGGNSAEPEIDVIVFPGEAVFEKVDRPGARVFALRFLAEAERTLLFWAQEPDESTDRAFIEAANLAFNSINDGMEEDSSGPISENPPAPSATPATDAPVTTDASGIGASQLAAALGHIMGGTAAAAGPSSGSGAPSGPPLTEVLKAERVAPLLSNPQLVERLAPFLPEEHRTPDAMVEIINSPQFKHQLAVLTQALETGQIDTSHFGLGPASYGVAEFLKAIQREAGKEEQGKKDEGKEQE